MANRRSKQRAQADDPDVGRHLGPWDAWPAVVVQEPEVLDLIRRAEAHELGRTFLEKGALGAVAATFGVHAFLVDAARQRIAEGA